MQRYSTLLYTLFHSKNIFDESFREKGEGCKTNLLLQGKGYLSTIIEWGDIANSTRNFDSSPFGVFAQKFTAYNISSKNKLMVTKNLISI